MIRYLIILVFILSVAIATGSILVSSKLRNAYKTEVFSTLMYILIFYFTFGFYAIWGQVIIVSFLSAFVSEEILNKTTNILALLGAPFIVFTWFVLLKFTREISGRMIGNSFFFLYLLTNIGLILATAIISSRYPLLDTFVMIKYSYVFLNLCYTALGTAYLLFRKRRKSLLRKSDVWNIAIGLLLMMVLQNALLVSYNGNIYVALTFILVFFLGGAFIPLYLRYKADMSVFIPGLEYKTTFDALCREFEITPREKEIIHEICNGLSNQQIADKLFISLQTVKDHTHRIYYKTHCSSRAQLITMVKDKI